MDYPARHKQNLEDMGRTLDYAEAKGFYDRFGAKQDDQAWYEDVATRLIFEHAELEGASSILELGCGTGRFAHELLSTHAPSARYVGLDISSTMIKLATARLEPFADRVTLHHTDGQPSAPVDQVDRYVSNYVLDLLSDDDIAAVFRDAHRILPTGGLLCLSSLTFGMSLRGRMTTALWRIAHTVRPKLVGGCRPIRFADYIDEKLWSTKLREVVEVRGLASEVWVGRKL